MRQIALCVLPAALAVTACMPQAATPEVLPQKSAPPPSASPPRPAWAPLSEPRIISQVDADRLLGNNGITLQWIGWDERGKVSVYPDKRGIWWLSSSQIGRQGARLLVEGRIVEIGEGYFTLDGVVSISNAPDAGRECRADKTWHFAITRNRKYYRLREFEWCDGLTDYVDIYF